MVSNDPVFSQEDQYFRTTEEAFERAAEMNTQFIKLVKKHRIDDMEQKFCIRRFVCI